jgi:hypothetical protein
LKARILLYRGDAEQAYRLLGQLPRDFRPTVRLWYRMRSSVAAGAMAAAFRHAAEFLDRLVDPRNADAPGLPRDVVYREIGVLIGKSRDPARGARLLSRAAGDGHGRYDRLLLLARTALDARQPGLAARAMDELLLWHPVDDEPLALCERIYRNRAPDRVRWCSERRKRLGDGGVGPALWR